MTKKDCLKKILRDKSLRMTTYLQRLPKIQKYFHKIHIVGKRIVSRDYDCTTKEKSFFDELNYSGSRFS